MPRRQYIADLQKAQEGALPQGVHALKAGADDGQFEFLFATSSGDSVQVTALIPDVGEYPKSHEYMIFGGEDAAPYFTSALSDLRKTSGKTVFELLDIVSTTLYQLSDHRDEDSRMVDSQFDDEEAQDDDDDDNGVYDSDDESFMIGGAQTTTSAVYSSGAQLRPADRAFRARVRSDLLLAKRAGFKVGVLGHLLAGFNAFVTVSIRMSKLGISEEAMQAWQVDSKDWLILILQYP